jgi:beta-lactamase superfamily II metal-dependent hydrolase
MLKLPSYYGIHYEYPHPKTKTRVSDPSFMIYWTKHSHTIRGPA